MRRCNCWECRQNRGLAALAPRLNAAWQLELAQRPLRREAKSKLLQAQRLQAHRELQLQRAQATRGKRSYARERARKLAEAQRIVARAQARVEALA